MEQSNFTLRRVKAGLNSPPLPARINYRLPVRVHSAAVGRRMNCLKSIGDDLHNRQLSRRWTWLFLWQSVMVIPNYSTHTRWGGFKHARQTLINFNTKERLYDMYLTRPFATDRHPVLGVHAFGKWSTLKLCSNNALELKAAYVWQRTLTNTYYRCRKPWCCARQYCCARASCCALTFASSWL